MFIISMRVSHLAGLSSLVKCLWLRKGVYPKVEHLKGTSLGYAPTLPANIRLGFKGLLGANTLAYYKRS